MRTVKVRATIVFTMYIHDCPEIHKEEAAAIAVEEMCVGNEAPLPQSRYNGSVGWDDARLQDLRAEEVFL